MSGRNHRCIKNNLLFALHLSIQRDIYSHRKQENPLLKSTRLIWNILIRKETEMNLKLFRQSFERRLVRVCTEEREKNKNILLPRSNVCRLNPKIRLYMKS